ncbi:MAG: hypothetical protein HONBIEJF_02167 [Fimbriimonadaceae bacterium]|nr:hypothetical protein [Fimbriimonadaceae bacterium]
MQHRRVICACLSGNHKCYAFIEVLRTLHVTLAIAAFLSWAVPVEGKVVYVRHGAAGNNTGVDWANAFTNPHSAFQTALSGDEIWIAKGVYHPGEPGDVNASFAIPSGVKVFGGFVGTEWKRHQRNWTLNETIFSGDLGDDDFFGNPWYNGWLVNSPNSLRVVTLTGAAQGTVVDGLVIAQGNGIYAAGAGLSAESSTFELRNCTFRRNSGYQTRGSCLYVLNGFATISNCRFVENWGRFVSGVGIATAGSAGCLVSGCYFYDNHAEADASSGNGAGIEFNGTAPSVVVNCTFKSNVSLPFFSSYPSYGGGIHNFGGALTVDRCTFDGNTAGLGGGIHSWKPITISNSLFQYNRAPAANDASGVGGAVSAYFYQDYELKMVGCTIVRNTAHETGGVWYNGIGNYITDISNCIFWDNSDYDGVVSQAQVKKASYSCIHNLWISRPGEDPIDPEKFPNCFDSNPQFITFPTNLRLKLTSPCVDAGDKTKFAGLGNFDRNNLLRFVDVATAPDTGNGTPPLPDLGCFEAALGRHLGIADGEVAGSIQP